MILCGHVEQTTTAGVATAQEVADLGLSCAVLFDALVSTSVSGTGMFDGLHRRDGDIESCLKSHVDAVVARLNSINHDQARRVARAIEYSWQGLTTDLDDFDLESFLTMRERYFGSLAKTREDEEASPSNDPFRHRTIPYWLNSLTASGSPVLKVQLEVRRLRKQKLYEQTRNVVRRALEQELMTGSNQTAVRTRLLEYLVDIDMDDGRWVSAVVHANMINQLHDSLPDRRTLSLEQRIKREQKLALLYDRAGDSATAKSLERSLLRRANALHATNWMQEVEIQVDLSNLQTVRRLEAGVSAIYLLARALLTLERHSDPDTEASPADEGILRKAFLPSRTMGLTLDTKPHWMTGRFWLCKFSGNFYFGTFVISWRGSSLRLELGAKAYSSGLRPRVWII